LSFYDDASKFEKGKIKERKEKVATRRWRGQESRLSPRAAPPPQPRAQTHKTTPSSAPHTHVPEKKKKKKLKRDQ
jgi:hypothetical protein